MANLSFRDILKSASVVGAGMIFSKAISLVAESIIVRQLSTTDFGAAIFGYTVLITLSSIALIGIPEGFTHYLSIYDERGDDVIALHTVVSGVVLVTAVLALSLCLIYLIPFEIIKSLGISQNQWRWILLLGPLVVAYPVSRVSFGIMRGYDKSVPKVLADDILNKLIAFTCLATAIWQAWTELIFLSFYLGQFLLSGLFAGSYVIYLLRTELENASITGRYYDVSRRLMSYSWPLALKNATRRLLGNTDLMFVGILLASSAVGYYRVGYVISQVGMLPLIAIMYLYTPRVTRQYDNDEHSSVEYLYRQATQWSTLLAFPLIVSMIFYPTELIRLLFGTEYAPGSIVLLILALDVLFRSGMGPAAATLQAIDRTKVDFIVTAVTVAFNAVLSYILIQEFGIAGAAIATFISLFMMNFIQVVLVYKYISVHPFSINYAKIILYGLLFGSFLFTILNHAPMDITVPVLRIPATMLLFIALFTLAETVYVWLSVFSGDQRDAVRNIASDYTAQVASFLP